MARTRTKKTRTEGLQDIINAWRDAHPGKPINMRQVYRWAIKKGDYSPPRYDPEKIGAREFARAAAVEYYTDPQGRAVRKKHVVRYSLDSGEQLFLWEDIADAKPQHMHMALSQRRDSSLGDVKQLKSDKDSYNDNNPHGAYIEMSFNFDEDLAELDHPTEYPDAPPTSD